MSREQVGRTSYERSRRSPKTVGKVVHTEIEGPFRPDVNGMRYFTLSVEESSCVKQVIALKTPDAAVKATGHYFDLKLRENISGGRPGKGHNREVWC